MSTWRRKALKLFPELRNKLNEKDNTTYSLFMYLRELVVAAYRNDNHEMQRNIFCFAEWCLHQKPEVLSNAAAVSFYEHLFDDYREDWNQIVPWLSPFVVESVSTLWELFHSPEELQQIHGLIEKRKTRHYQECSEI